jgi:LmbE family N-acetylglucosaminyl deacetylase
MDGGYLPHKISHLYIFGHPEPNVKLEITGEVETKIQAILCHKTQIADPENGPKRWLERWGEEQRDGSRRYYEMFKAMKFG